MSRRNTFKRIMLSKKRCDTCNEEKPISEFRLQWRNLDGTMKKEPHEDSCRICAHNRMVAALKEAGVNVGDEDPGEPHDPTVY